MHTVTVSSGVQLVEIPEAGLSVLCGCPADSVKLLMKKGLIAGYSKDGVAMETGPNAILLSDASTQHETFCNLSEFPILQMLYRQGMMVPGHPGNTGRKPLLVGLESQVRSQSQYIFRGNYGLSSLEEIMSAGVPRETAEDYLRMKLWFAFGRIRPTEELMEFRFVGGSPVELRAGATVKRLGFNVYEFAFRAEKARVDLNLRQGERYPASYSLGFHRIRREYFSVVHLGEGDGWDTEKPCMGSLITFQGRIYLIDAGPNIEQSLTAIGISVNEIEGVFHSHSHDDHFAGFTSLVRSDHRIKYYATPPVRASVARKLSALMGMDEAMFTRYFEVHDLRAAEWNDVDGLQVKPEISAHPVETNVFHFRALWDGGYRTYAHLADVVAFETLHRMASASADAPGVSKAFAERLERELRAPADLKKLDAGGGLIHGAASDFAGDESGRLILSHVVGELSAGQKEIGSNAVFGGQDVLIPANVDYAAQSAFRFLSTYFPEASGHSVRMLANCRIVSLNAGSIIYKKGEHVRTLFLMLQGVAEVVDSQQGAHKYLSGGTLVGELASLLEEPAFWTVRACSYVTALEIPRQLYLEFIRQNALEESTRRLLANRRFLQGTWLFGEMLGFPTERAISAAMETQHVAAGSRIAACPSPCLSLLASGEVELLRDGKPWERLSAGGFWGEDEVLDGKRIHEARAVTEVDLFLVPARLIADIPIVQWRLLQTREKRMHGGAL
jgi:hemerythrin